KGQKETSAFGLRSFSRTKQKWSSARSAAHRATLALRCTPGRGTSHRLDAALSTVASCPPERFINLMGNIAPGPADVVKLSLGQPGQFAPHLGSVAPRMEDFGDLVQRPSEHANSMMICHQEN